MEQYAWLDKYRKYVVFDKYEAVARIWYGLRQTIIGISYILWHSFMHFVSKYTMMATLLPGLRLTSWYDVALALYEQLVSLCWYFDYHFSCSGWLIRGDDTLKFLYSFVVKTNMAEWCTHARTRSMFDFVTLLQRYKCHARTASTFLCWFAVVYWSLKLVVSWVAIRCHVFCLLSKCVTMMTTFFLLR